MARHIAHFDTACDYTWLFTVTHIHTLVPTVTSSLSLLGSGFQRRTFHFLRFPNCPRPQLPASNSNSSQGLNRNSSLTHFSLTAAVWQWVRVRVRVRVTLRLVVYRQSLRLGAKILEDHDQQFFFATEPLWSYSLCNIFPTRRQVSLVWI
jgi:hypothetical protein